MRSLGAELRKLSTLRTAWVVTAIGLAVGGLTTGLTLFVSPTVPGPDGGTTTIDLTGGAGLAEVAVDGIGGNSVWVLIVGILVVTTEFRHGTAGWTFLARPRRIEVVAAKLAAAVVHALAFVAGSLLVVAGLLTAAATGDEVTVDGAVLTATWQATAALALTALFGVAVGALLRSQVLSLVLTLVWMFAVEVAVAALLPAVGRWLPFQALQNIFSPEAFVLGPVEPVDPLLALAAFVGYVVVFAGAGTVMLARRDV